MKRIKAFTLIELIVTMAIAGILIAIAAPSFSGLMKRNRITANVNGLLGAINLARSEAVKLGANVQICKSSDGSACASSGGWEQGWLVWEVGTDPANIILVQSEIGNNNSISGTSPITFSASGRTSAAVTFVFCNGGSVDGNTKVVKLTKFGRAGVRSDEADPASC